MPPPRKTILAIRGLITTPNEFGVYPEGSCSRCENALARAANQWVIARDTELVCSLNSVGQVVSRLVGTAPGVVIAIAYDQAGPPTWWIRQNNGASTDNITLNSPVSSSGLFDATGYLTPTIARNRLYVNSRQGVLVLDKLAPASAGERVLRSAGLPQPTIQYLDSVPGAVIPANTLVSYAALVRRVTADGYVMVSPPTFAVRTLETTGTARDYEMWLSWAYTTDFQVGDVVELYRSAGIPTSDLNSDSGTSMRLVSQFTLTATEIAARFVKVKDLRPMSAPLYETAGTEIYTSPYQDGSTGANLPPPVCKTIAQWGDYTFYGNVTDDPSWLIDVPGGIMDTAAGGAAATAFVRANGIGNRSFTGTTTIGSPTVTGISAADMVGLAVGQRWSAGAPFAVFNTTVIAVGASSVTMSANASSSATATFGLADVFSVNGATDVMVYSMANLAWSVGFLLSGNMAVYPSETIPFQIGVQPYVLGTTVLLAPKRPGYTTTLTVRGTNGQNYTPAIPDIAASPKTITQTERPNVLRWSRPNQPEAVPSGNEAFIGAGSIIRLLPTTDCLWALCTDGAYRITGAAGRWQRDLVDPTFIPIAPDACCVHNEVVYAWTPRGIASLSGTTTSLLTKGVLDAEFPPRQFEANAKIHLYANPTTEELIVVVQDPSTLSAASTIYVYSILYRQWSTYVPAQQALTAVGTFRPAAASGEPYPVFGWYGSGVVPTVRSWRSDSGNVVGDAKFYLQPLYAGDPLMNKQWIDCTWIGGPANPVVTSIDQYVNAGTYSGSGYLAGTANGESRGSIGIPRSAAIAPTLRLWGAFHSWPSYAPTVIKGLSLRYVPLTSQQRRRA